MNAETKSSPLPVVVGLGEVLWDVFPEGAQLGGAPANFACHAAALGVQASIVSVVGRDELGDRTLEALVSRGVEVDCIEKSDLPTGRVNVSVNERGEPNYEISDGVAWEQQVWTTERDTLAKSCDAVCFGTLGQRSPAAQKFITEFLQRTSPNCIRVFDVNLRQSFYSDPMIVESLQLASVLKLNDDELPVVCKAVGIEPRATDAAYSLRQKFDLDLVALTQGSTGAQLIGGQRTDFSPATATKVKDTVGAGDAYTAALTVGLLRDLNPSEINQAACSIAAFVCSQPGATPDLPTDLKRLLVHPS